MSRYKIRLVCLHFALDHSIELSPFASDAQQGVHVDLFAVRFAPLLFSYCRYFCDPRRGCWLFLDCLLQPSPDESTSISAFAQQLFCERYPTLSRRSTAMTGCSRQDNREVDGQKTEHARKLKQGFPHFQRLLPIGAHVKVLMGAVVSQETRREEKHPG